MIWPSKALDSSGLLSKIQALPGQLDAAYHAGLSEGHAGVDFRAVRQIVVIGLGDAVIGADLLAAFSNDLLSIPLIINRSDQLPAWAKGSATLVLIHPCPGMACGGVELLDQATQCGCSVICVGRPPEASPVLCWEPPAEASSAWYFGRLYAALEGEGLLPGLKADLDEALQAMGHSLAALQPDVPAARNPAKRLAGQFYDRRVLLFAAGFLAPAARLWKMRINTFAKAGADLEIIPEADYNSLAGLDHPASGIKDLMAVFLRASSLSSRDLQSLDLTRQVFLQQGINTDFVDARGVSRLAQLWTTILFAEMTAYYLAMAYGIDPAQKELLEAFQAEMTYSESSGGM